MPINGPSSYIVTVPLFINHWNDANATGTTILLDPVATGQAAPASADRLTELNEELIATRDTLEATLLDEALLQAEVLAHRTWLKAQTVAFNQNVRADHGTTPFAQVLPTAPGIADAREKFNRPLRLTAALWLKVNTFRAAMTPAKPALTLPGGVTLANFNTRLAQLKDAMDNDEEREQQAALDRANRDAVQRQIYPILKVYRLKIEATFPAPSPILETLPALTENAAATPQPGSLSGSYNAGTNSAVLNGQPSPSPTVVRHQIRASVGAEPSLEDEALSAEFEVGDPITLTTNYGFGAPGAIVHFRLVAITADGHEKGTPWLTLQRPL